MKQNRICKSYEPIKDLLVTLVFISFSEMHECLTTSQGKTCKYFDTSK